jgi:hypothetical protein
MNLGGLINYKKLLAALTAGIVVAGAALQDGTITSQEWVQIGAAVLGALGVYSLRNGRKVAKGLRPYDGPQV